MTYHLTETAKNELIAQSFTYFKYKKEVEDYIEGEFNRGELIIQIPDEWVIGANKYMKPTVFATKDMFEMSEFEPDYGVWYDFKECHKAAIINEWDTVVYRDIYGRIVTNPDDPSINEFAVIEDVPF